VGYGKARRVAMLARHGPWSLSSNRETGIDTTHLQIRVMIGSLAFRLTKTHWDTIQCGNDTQSFWLGCAAERSSFSVFDLSARDPGN